MGRQRDVPLINTTKYMQVKLLERLLKSQWRAAFGLVTMTSYLRVSEYVYYK